MLRTPKTDEIVVIYETLKNRRTGSHTQVIDLRPEGKKYALKCATHGTQVERNVRLAAEAESHRSHEWCKKCVDKTVDPRPSIEVILEVIGRATAKKTCLKKMNEAGL